MLTHLSLFSGIGGLDLAAEAAGFRFDGITKGGSWSTPSRPRVDKAPTCRKQRWVKET